MGASDPQLRAGDELSVDGESLFIPSAAADQLIHLRNRFPTWPHEFTGERTVVLVHGATFSSEAMFDVNLPGGSWLERLVAAGFDVYLLDIRGYGRSTRPRSMEEKPAANPPFSHTEDAIGDLERAVDFIRKRRGVDRVNIIGWSWGTAIAAGYAARYPERVCRLVLYGPLWKISGTPPVSGSGAYRIATKRATRERVLRGIPAKLVEKVSPTAWFNQWWEAALATDPAGARRPVPGVRAPNGVSDDIDRFWSRGKATYDPAAITAPTLLIVGEWDQDTPIGMATALFLALTGCQDKRLTLIKEATHWLLIERGREELIRKVEDFLLSRPQAEPSRR